MIRSNWERTFQLADVITYIPDGAGDGFGLGPRTIVMTKDLENSGLSPRVHCLVQNTE